MYSFIMAFLTHSLTHSLARSLTHSLARSLAHSRRHEEDRRTSLSRLTLRPWRRWRPARRRDPLVPADRRKVITVSESSAPSAQCAPAPVARRRGPRYRAHTRVCGVEDDVTDQKKKSACERLIHSLEDLPPSTKGQRDRAAHGNRIAGERITRTRRLRGELNEALLAV